MSGRHFRDYHLLLDDQGTQIFAMTDDIAERARKIGGTTLHSIGDISRHQRLEDNNEESVSPQEMIAELCADNQRLVRSLRDAHELCDEHGDVATTFRHSAANQIEAEIRYDRNQLRLRVRDDGKGIEPKVLEVSRRPGHWGLPGVSERAERIGARLRIWSEAGAGTEIELTVPAAIAYKGTSNDFRFKLFRRDKAS